MSPHLRPTIVKKDVPLPCPRDKGKLAFTLDNVLTPKECEELIAKTEKQGYELALVNVGFGKQRAMTDVRNSSRCIIDDEAYAAELWSRIKDYVPEEFKGRTVIGLNERLRYLRYDDGEYFKPHNDGAYIRENGERSLITYQLYLNEGFEGGATNFLRYDEDDEVPVVPKTGSVLIFQHDILHEGATLIKGRKYAMRTDVMYSATTHSYDGRGDLIPIVKPLKTEVKGSGTNVDTGKAEGASHEDIKDITKGVGKASLHEK